MDLKNKKILLVIGGGISAYKSLDLIRLLQRKSCSIKVILTKTGKKFVTSLSISSLSKNRVFEEIFDEKNKGNIDHISLSRWADLIMVLPTTANFMFRLSKGSAEDLASTIILASNKETFLVPAMNVRMWEHKSTKINLKKLKDFGYKFIGKGTQYCDVPIADRIHMQQYNFVIEAGIMKPGTYVIFHHYETVDSNTKVFLPSTTDQARFDPATSAELMIIEYGNF